MQRPQRRRRQRREEKVAWLRGLGRAEDVWTVAQETSTEVTVAGVGCEREKKRLQRREKGWQEKREPRWQLGGRLVVVLASCGGDGGRGRNGGSVGYLWRRKKEKDAEEENLHRGEGKPRGGCAYRR